MNKNIVITLLVVVIGILASAVFDYYPFADRSISSSKQNNEVKISYWVAPMDANYRRDEPGKSPMGMDLIPVYEGKGDGGGEEDKNVIKVKPSVINNIGVRSGKVKRGTIGEHAETVGYIDYDESKISHIHMRAEGWVEKLYVNSVGERVKEGDLLFEVYAPSLVNAQSEYLQALGGGRSNLIRASKDRLQALGISGRQIKKLVKTRKVDQLVQVYAPQDGVVSELNITDGMHVKPTTTTISLADLSSIWILVDMFEQDAGWVKEGLEAEMRLSYDTGKVWSGKITYIYPEIDPKTRTLKARMQFDNPGEVLKPNMYVDVLINGAGHINALYIPREALIRTGNSERVILDLGDGRFKPVAVRAGLESGDNIEILSGLKEDQDIVISAQFLIDSEASFSGSAIRMEDAQPEMDEQDMSVHQGEEPLSGVSVGIVNMVMPDMNKINLTHDPIPEIDWPGMTMDLMVSEEVNLEGLKKGDSVEFKVQKSSKGYFHIIEIEAVNHD